MEKILVIDDDKMSRDVASQILTLANYEVLQADNGQSGLEIALQRRPDLIVCDIVMPVLDGYGVLRVAQKHPLLRHTPVIVCSGNADISEVRRAMDSGADDFIAKPFCTTDLLGAIESRLRKHQYAAALLPGDAPPRPALRGERWEDAVRQLVEGRNINSFGKRHLLYEYGCRVQHVYYVLSGKLRTFVRNDNGKDLVLELYGPGDFVGYEALLGEGIYRNTAETLEYAELAVIPREDMQQAIAANAEVQRAFFRMLSKSLERKQRYQLLLAYDSLRRKVAQALLRLERKFGDGQTPFRINLAREVMASIAGTATESLIRTLGDFRNEGLIDVEANGAIVVRDAKRLEAIHA
ncbi:MAG: response regulator [Chitinophagaceae bacterium]|nr:MAG: response regulator [Chitinophagaceae bacterium]